VRPGGRGAAPAGMLEVVGEGLGVHEARIRRPGPTSNGGW
jgi:hypothetical protein